MTLILIVEDTRVLANSMEAVLTRHGYQVRVALTTSEAFLEGEPVDLILVDHAVTGGAARNFTESLLGRHPSAGVVHVADCPRVVVEEAIGTVMPAGFVQKPFTPKELMEAVKETLARRAA